MIHIKPSWIKVSWINKNAFLNLDFSLLKLELEMENVPEKKLIPCIGKFVYPKDTKIPKGRDHYFFFLFLGLKKSSSGIPSIWIMIRNICQNHPSVFSLSLVQFYDIIFPENQFSKETKKSVDFMTENLWKKISWCEDLVEGFLPYTWCSDGIGKDAFNPEKSQVFTNMFCMTRTGWTSEATKNYIFCLDSKIIPKNTVDGLNLSNYEKFKELKDFILFPTSFDKFKIPVLNYPIHALWPKCKDGYTVSGILKMNENGAVLEFESNFAKDFDEIYKKGIQEYQTKDEIKKKEYRASVKDYMENTSTMNSDISFVTQNPFTDFVSPLNRMMRHLAYSVGILPQDDILFKSLLLHESQIEPKKSELIKIEWDDLTNWVNRDNLLSVLYLVYGETTSKKYPQNFTHHLLFWETLIQTFVQNIKKQKFDSKIKINVKMTYHIFLTFNIALELFLHKNRDFEENYLTIDKLHKPKFGPIPPPQT